jgi:hypothetical protein
MELENPLLRGKKRKSYAERKNVIPDNLMSVFVEFYIHIHVYI